MTRKKFQVGETVRVVRLSPTAMKFENPSDVKILEQCLGCVGCIDGYSDERAYPYTVTFYMPIAGINEYNWSAYELERIDV